MRPVFALALFLCTLPAMALDLNALWDYRQPDVSEQRFRAALASATGDDALILQTQIARTYGLRKNFSKAREVLTAIAAQVATAGAEARIRYALEMGRSYASAAHTPEQLTPEAKQLARQAYDSALTQAKAAALDGLAIDAIHMFAFIDTAPADQLKWAQEALAVVLASNQPDARRWEASIRNNIGMALHKMGRFPEALDQFQQAVLLREKSGNAQNIRVAHWMVAWTLRALHRTDEALAIQTRLERENEAAGQPDKYVFEELEMLYRAKGDSARAQQYGARRQALP